MLKKQWTKNASFASSVRSITADWSSQHFRLPKEFDAVFFVLGLPTKSPRRIRSRKIMPLAPSMCRAAK